MPPSNHFPITESNLKPDSMFYGRILFCPGTRVVDILHFNSMRTKWLHIPEVVERQCIHLPP